MKKLMKNQKGMTLIELLAVIVIIAIIALIAIPAISSIINNSKDKAILSDASQIISSAKIAIADGACDGSPETTTGSGETAVTTAASCNEGTIASYLEKADLPEDATYSVTKDDATYTLTYSGFKDFKTDKFTGEGKVVLNQGGTSGTVTAVVLATLMGGK